MHIAKVFFVTKRVKMEFPKNTRLVLVKPTYVVYMSRSSFIRHVCHMHYYLLPY